MSPLYLSAVDPLVGLRFAEARQRLDGFDALHGFGFRHELGHAALAGRIFVPVNLALLPIFANLLRASARGSAQSGREQKGRQDFAFHKTSLKRGMY